MDYLQLPNVEKMQNETILHFQLLLLSICLQLLIHGKRRNYFIVVSSFDFGKIPERILSKIFSCEPMLSLLHFLLVYAQEICQLRHIAEENSGIKFKISTKFSSQWHFELNYSLVSCTASGKIQLYQKMNESQKQNH